MSLYELKKEIREFGTEERAAASQRYFKTGKGEYGEGDIFLGLTVPECRKIAMKYKELSLSDVQQLLKSKIHEERFCALEILNFKYEKADEKERKNIFDFYLTNITNINNWDLVDTSAPYIVGEYLADKDKLILLRLAKSGNLWGRRIAIIATSSFIKRGKFNETLKISELLLKDKHDLIHKAVGWMLREVGNRNMGVEEEFLKRHYKQMPRTMLRYAIEKFPEERRKAYLAGKI